MGRISSITIPVPPEVADAIEADTARQAALGRLVGALAAPGAFGVDPLIQFLGSLPRDPVLPELDEVEIAAEVSAARAARRS